MPGSVIVAGARTPIGKLSGALAGFTGHGPRRVRHQGGARAGRHQPASRSTTCSWARCSRPAGPDHGPPGRGQGRHPDDRARHHHQQGLPSGLNSIYLADQMISAGEADIVVAGGMESMTQAPHLLPGAREGYRIGDATLVDSMMFDGLFCAFDVVRHGRRHREVHRRRRHHHPRDRRTRSPPTPTSGPRPPSRRALRRRDRQRRGAPAQGRPDHRRHRRGRAPRHHRRDAGQAASRLRRRRHHHRRQRLADLRRRRRRGRDVEGGGRAGRRRRPSARSSPTARSAGPDASLLTQPSRSSIQAHREGRHEGERRRPVRVQRGLRRRRPRLDGRPRHHRRDRATSTAAPSPSATRSACPAPAWPSPCSTSSSAAAAAPASPPSAAAAARATPCSSRPCSHPLHSGQRQCAIALWCCPEPRRGFDGLQ